jgi:hypothetical protein
MLAVTALALAAACGDGTAPGGGDGNGGGGGGGGGGVIQLVDSIPIPDNYGLHDEYVRDGVAFVSAWNTGMIIMDAGGAGRGGTAAKPVEISRIVTSVNGVNSGAAVHNSWWFHNPVTGEKRYLFIGQEGYPTAGIGGGSSGDLHVVDVADLAHPTEVAFFHYRLPSGDSAGVHNLWMDEQAQILYAAFYNGGVVALDVSGTLQGDLAAQHRLLAAIQPGGAGNTFTWGVQLYNGSLYAIDMLSGFYQLKYASGAFTKVAGGNNVPARFSSDLWVANGYAYTGAWGSRNGVRGNVVSIWRLSAAGAPELADSIVVPGVTTISDDEVSADGKYLMVTTEGAASTDPTPNGLYVYGLANPAKPTLLGHTTVTTGLHTGTFVNAGGRRYVWAARDPGNSALMIFDVTGVAP